MREATSKRLGLAALLVAVAAPSAVSGQSWRDVTMSRQLQGRGALNVDVEYAAGRLTVRSVDDDLLYRMNLRYDEDTFEPVADLDGDRLRLGIESIRRRSNVRGRQSGELDLELARGVPMDLDLDFGAVRADIDLGGLSLTSLIEGVF